MGLFSRSSNSNSDAVSNLRAADKALRDNSAKEKAAGIIHETPEYLALNAAASQAASNVSRWRGGSR